MATTTKPLVTLTGAYPRLTAASGVNWQNVNGKVLTDLENLAEKFKTNIFLTSGYRTSAQSIAAGGSAGDPHAQGIAVDATIGGKPIGDVLTVAQIGSVGLTSGNTAGFWPGHDSAYARSASDPAGADPVHVQLGATSTGTTTTGGSSGTNAPPGWAAKVLGLLGIKATAADVTFLDTWQTYEKSNATNNPLNTTLVTAASTGEINSAHVQNFGTALGGEQANAAFLQNYTSLVAALKSGDPYGYAAKSDANAQGVVSNLSKWGSKNFSAVFAYQNNVAYTDTTTNQTNRDPATGGQTSTTTTGPTGVLGEITAVLEWPFQQNRIQRAGWILAGAILVIIAISCLFRSVSVVSAATVAAHPVSAAKAVRPY